MLESELNIETRVIEAEIIIGGGSGGVTGPQGPQGPQGEQGPAGTNGTDGTNGADGNGIKSTVDNGNGTFTITYDDNTTFTTSDLTGPQGPAGADGNDGAQGPQGEQGPQGNVGPAGTTIEQEILGDIEVDVAVTGTKNIAVNSYASFRYSLTGTTTLTESGTPASNKSCVRTFIVTGNQTLNLPASWATNKVGTYDGTKRNLFTVSYMNVGGTLEVDVVITQMN